MTKGILQRHCLTPAVYNTFSNERVRFQRLMRSEASAPASVAVPSQVLLFFQMTWNDYCRNENTKLMVCLLFLGESAFEFWADDVQDMYCHILLPVICDWLFWGVIPVTLSTAHTRMFFGRLYQLRKIQYFLVYAQKPHIDLIANFTVEACDVSDLLKTKVYVFKAT